VQVRQALEGQKMKPLFGIIFWPEATSEGWVMKLNKKEKREETIRWKKLIERRLRRQRKKPREHPIGLRKNNYFTLFQLLLL
jgi:hypothetical protein